MWTHYLKLDGVLHCVVSHTKFHVDMLHSVQYSCRWIPVFWKNHPNPTPGSVWDRRWNDEPCLSQFNLIVSTGLDGLLFSPLLRVTTAHRNLKRGSMFLRNVGIYLESYAVSEPRTPQSEDKCQFGSVSTWCVIYILMCGRVYQKETRCSKGGKFSG